MMFRTLTKQLMNREDGHRDLLKRILEVETQLIEELQKSRDQIFKQLADGDLEEQYLKAIEEVYAKENRDYLTGKLAN